MERETVRVAAGEFGSDEYFEAALRGLDGSQRETARMVRGLLTNRRRSCPGSDRPTVRVPA